MTDEKKEELKQRLAKARETKKLKNDIIKRKPLKNKKLLKRKD